MNFKLWEIGLSVVMAVIIGIMLYGFFAGCGLQLRKKGSVLEHVRVLQPEQKQPMGKPVFFLFVGAIGFRLFVYLASAVVLLMNLGDAETFSLPFFLEHWKQWDASNYIRIAENGYSGSLVDGKPLFLVFFPLYSYGIRLFNLIFGNSMVSALVLSTIAYGAGCCYFYKLVYMEYGKSVAEGAVLFLSIFPFGFFFGAMMTESLFLFVTAGALYYIRRHNWPACALFGALAGMTRMQGLLLVIPAFVEMMITYKPLAMIRKKRYGLVWRLAYSKMAWIAPMGFGTLYYLFVNYKVTGDALKFLTYQKEHWFQESCYFTKTVDYVFRNAFQYDNKVVQISIWIPQAVLFLAGLGILAYGIGKCRSTYLFYYLAYFLMNYSVTWLLSGARYMSCALPMFMILAILAEKKPKGKWGYVAGSSILFGIYLTGYLYGRHIM